MNKTEFGKTGLNVSVLGYGGAPIGTLDEKLDRVKEIVDVLLESGVNLFDTAACYGESELLLGEALKGRRDDLVVVSKCGHSPDGLEAEEWTADVIEESVNRSLKRLKMDFLDVILLHTCDKDVLEKQEIWAALEKVKDQGKVRFVGYSGDNETAQYAAGLPQVDVIETSVSICDQRNIGVVLPAARENNVGVLAKRPIANAAWIKAEEHKGFYEEYSRPYVERLSKMGIEPADLGFDGAPEEVWPEIALRFTVSQPGVHTAIVGTTNPSNARANIDALSKGPLPEDAVSKLRQAFRSADPDDEWKGLG